MDGSWDVNLASPTDFFTGADDIPKMREQGIEIIGRTPYSLIITSYYKVCSFACVGHVDRTLAGVQTIYT